MSLPGVFIRVVDFETTGMPEDVGGAALVEVGWQDLVVAYNAATLIGDPNSILCNPGRPMPAGARAVHHISDADVAAAVSPTTALQAVFAGDPAYLVAHKADFEAAFCTSPMPWICTWKAALRLWPDAESWSNQYLRYYLKLELPRAFAMPPHRAAPDAYVTAHIFAECLRDGRSTLEKLAHWNTGPGLLPKVTFGKHKGKRWEEVPADYLEWIIDKSEFDRDVKANAKHHLKLRANKGKT